jgi:hypothetical protein
MIISLYNYLVKIQRNSIQLSMAMSLLQLSLEIQNHFKIFEHIRRFDITVVTLANTQDETFILCNRICKYVHSNMLTIRNKLHQDFMTAILQTNHITNIFNLKSIYH